MYSAASKIKGGRSTVKSRSRENCTGGKDEIRERARPAITRPILYGSRKRLDTMATTAAINSRSAIFLMPSSMACPRFVSKNQNHMTITQAIEVFSRNRLHGSLAEVLLRCSASFSAHKSACHTCSAVSFEHMILEQFLTVGGFEWPAG